MAMALEREGRLGYLLIALGQVPKASRTSDDRRKLHWPAVRIETHQPQSNRLATQPRNPPLRRTLTHSALSSSIFSISP